jgi:protein-S-isoprenylcysteine O-methyltransferase Ste14
VHPPHAVWYLVAPVAVVSALAELRRALVRRPGSARAGWRGEVAIRGAIAAGVLGAALFQARVPGATIAHAGVFGWIAAAALAGGVALRLWSFRTLGRYFTLVVATSPDQPVIDRGPYGLVRHPSYTALILMAIAAGILVGNWLSLAVLAAAVTAALALRIRIEEAALLRALGDSYRDYASTRKRLVPFVW